MISLGPVAEINRAFLLTCPVRKKGNSSYKKYWPLFHESFFNMSKSYYFIDYQLDILL